jgi:hypothetical protein
MVGAVASQLHGHVDVHRILTRLIPTRRIRSHIHGVSGRHHGCSTLRRDDRGVLKEKKFLRLLISGISWLGQRRRCLIVTLRY